MAKPAESKFTYWIGLLSLALIYWLKILANPHYQTTFDSIQYLALADKLLSGTSWWSSGQVNESGNVFVPYAPAYPLAIALVKLVSGLPTLWASKLLGFGCLWALYSVRHVQHNSVRWLYWVLLSSDAVMHVLTHTWAESLIMAGFVIMIFHHHKHWAFAAISGLLAINARTASFAITLGSVLQGAAVRLAGYRLWPIYLIGNGLLMAYIGYEGIHSQLLTGGVREAVVKQWGVSDLARVLGQQMAVVKMAGGAGVRNITFNLVQGILPIAVCGYLTARLAMQKKPEAMLLIAGGMFYLALNLTITRFYTLAEGLDIRLMLPGMFLILTGLLMKVEMKPVKAQVQVFLIVTLTLIHLPWRWLLA